MSVELETKNRINSLIAAANAKTGNADTDLTGAIGSLFAAIEAGGAAMQSGSFTPAENLLTYEIPVTGEIKNFCFIKQTNSVSAGMRAFVGGFLIDGFQWIPGLTTNASGVSMVSIGLAEDRIIIGDGKVTLQGNSGNAYPGYLVPVTYDWVAW